jgi:hypothetical protein
MLDCNAILARLYRQKAKRSSNADEKGEKVSAIRPSNETCEIDFVHGQLASDRLLRVPTYLERVLQN